MGIAKRKYEEKEYYKDMAFRIMVEIGAIKTCDIHDDFYYNTCQYDNEQIYSIVTAKIKNEYSESNDYKLLHEIICEILSQAASSADECSYCEKIENE